MDKCLLQIVLVSKEGGKHEISPKKSSEDPENYRTVHMEFTLGNFNKEYVYVDIYDMLGRSQHSSMKRKVMTWMITVFLRSH